ncbi:MAG TPA: hypothetical protein PKC18_15660 [Lacipirellulaceae bacterium]|nr:hypothetical protein [Lacipirellulaceae bacterium]
MLLQSRRRNPPGGGATRAVRLTLSRTPTRASCDLRGSGGWFAEYLQRQANRSRNPTHAHAAAISASGLRAIQ